MYMVTYISKLIDSSHLDTQFSKKVTIKIFFSPVLKKLILFLCFQQNGKELIIQVGFEEFLISISGLPNTIVV